VRLQFVLLIPTIVIAQLVRAIHTRRDAWVFMDRPDKPGDDDMMAGRYKPNRF
jgi:hypothetical protein